MQIRNHARLFQGLAMVGTIAIGCASQDEGISIKEKPWEEVPFTLISAEIKADTLVSVVQYGGGCGEHAFELVAAGPLMKSLPPKQPLRWVHRSTGDPCRALILDTVRAELSAFRGSPHGTTVLSLEGAEENLIYTYH